MIAPMAVPCATYRIQFTPGFGFADLAGVLDYLAELGIAAIYASPVFKARPGSDHGYDVCDHNTLNPELGDRAAFDELTARRKELDLAWLQDFVPNHMAVSGDNQTLVDLLENGPDSRYFAYFDIDWEHPIESIRGQMLAPFLGGYFGETLERGEIQLGFDERGFFVSYWDLRLPVRIATYPEILTPGLGELRRELGAEHPDHIKLLGVLYSIKNLPEGSQPERYDQISFSKRLLFELYQDSEPVRAYIDATLAAFNGKDESQEPGPGRFDKLERLLAEQYFRLSFWKVASDEIDYRRFFSINDLISLRVEEAEVFETIHSLVFELAAEGALDGLRIDHIDGLYDPTVYLRRLREKLPGAYIVVEKILELDEPLPSFWPIQGTTGYEFMNAVCGLFVAGDNEQAFRQVYRRFAGRRPSLEAAVAEDKLKIIERHMGGDVDNLARLINWASSHDRRGFDITMNAMRQAITEVLIHFPVYRSYISYDAFRPADLTYIQSAVRAARRARPELAYELEFLERFLTLQYDESASETQRRNWIHFVMRFQQFTGPLMAKGFEDTALYAEVCLLALNEVGGDPARFGVSDAFFSEFLNERCRLWPQAMNATATHDTKRGEDARMRLAALSELPGEWEQALKTFRRINARRKRKRGEEPLPSANDEYLLYQALLAHWPFPGSDEEAAFPQRLADYYLKALREAKEHTGWITPDEEYEEAALAFAKSLLRSRNKPERNAFLTAFLPLQRRLAHLGMLYSLGQCALKMTAPGLPDIFQGTELWDLSFVDPDNRRPVDYARRRELLAGLSAELADNPERLCRSLLSSPQDGRVKLFLTWRLLALRAEHPELFSHGDFELVSCEGARAGQVLCLLREEPEDHDNPAKPRLRSLTLVPRRLAGMLAEGRYPVGGFWEETRVAWPERLRTGRPGQERVRVKEALTGRELAVEVAFEGLPEVFLRDALRDLPVAVLVLEPEQG